jgi:hypothetical protein
MRNLVRTLVRWLRPRWPDDAQRGQSLVACLALAGLVAFACLTVTIAFAHGAGAVLGP